MECAYWYGGNGKKYTIAYTSGKITGMTLKKYNEKDTETVKKNDEKILYECPGMVTNTYTQTYTCMYTHLHIHIKAHTHTKYTNTYIHVHTCIDICTYMYICVYMPMFLISSYGSPLAKLYDYIVTNSINSLLIGSRCIPNGEHTNHC